MKITISQDKEIKEIELTPLQEKSVKLMGGVGVLIEKIRGVLVYLEEQARQRYAAHKLETITEQELDVVIVEMGDESNLK